MTKQIKVSILFIVWIIFFLFLFWVAVKVADRSGQDVAVFNYPEESKTWWEFQAIDTMKYSRDMSGQYLEDKNAAIKIDNQVRLISEIGATHVAIATPYDEKFLPVLSMWVESARKHNLKVWFRGNFSRWENWFGYKRRITRNEHLELTKNFILNNKGLFENGDYFTSCPECENGGPGNPFTTGDFEGHRRFLIDSYNISTQAFKTIGLNVQVNLNSMNGDVAKKIMDESTTSKLGGIVTVDHYVRTPEQLNADIDSFSNHAKSPVILGEYGAPIPDLHGKMTQEQQAEWIDKSLSLLSKNKNLIGISYWTNIGGSTELWNEKGEPRLAVDVLKKYFKPKLKEINAVDDVGNPIPGANVISEHRKTSTNNNGVAYLPTIGDEEIRVTKNKYKTVNTHTNQEGVFIVEMKPENESLFYRIRQLIRIK